MTVLLHPGYFPNVAHFVAMLQSDVIVFEAFDNYQKQTYRNRSTVFGANGSLDLNVPVVYSQNNRQLYKDVEIFNADNWQQQHLKSLESAYRTSPFFEYYIDDFMPLFTKSYTHIMALNLDCLKVVFDCLQVPFQYSLTSTFELEPEGVLDARPLINCRKEIRQDFKVYAQVFDDKHQFLHNLSILDLLFNEGPASEIYLQAQTLQLP